MARTDDGRLFAWGSNEYLQCGLDETVNYYSPTQVPFFSDYFVHDFDVGDCHSMIYASSRNNPGYKQMFLVSNKEFVISMNTGDHPYIIEYEPFCNIKYDWIE